MTTPNPTAQNEQINAVNAVLVIRHELLEAQKQAIEKANIKIVEKVHEVPQPNTPEFNKFVQELKAKGVNAVLTVALPPHILSALQNAGLRILIFKMRSVKVTENEEEAKKFVEEKPTHRVALQGALGEKKTFRLLEFEGIFEVKVVIEEKPIITV